MCFIRTMFQIFFQGGLARAQNELNNHRQVTLYTAVSRKVVQKKHKSIRDNTERHHGKLSV